MMFCRDGGLNSEKEGKKGKKAVNMARYTLSEATTTANPWASNWAFSAF
jgi:hypothetical protein